MNNSLIHSVFETVQKYAVLAQDQRPAPRSHRPLFDPRPAYPPVPASLPDVASRISALGLPAPVSQELGALFERSLPDERAFVEQIQGRMLEELSTLSVSPDPSMIPSLVQSALGAIHRQSINARMEALQQEIATLELNTGSASDSGDSSDSDEDSISGDEDEDEEMEDVADEDDNAPVRPGEDIPPLDTVSGFFSFPLLAVADARSQQKYLPIFEALHERGKVLTKPEKTYLVDMTGMTYRQITIWFQNRRRGELKEDMHARASSSHVASVHSDQSSDDSDDELDLERRVATTPLDTSFNIRSWCLASAAATKNDAHVPPLPPSPTKFGFGPIDTVPSFVSDDSDLSDTDEEATVPPGLRVPSLAMSVTTLDSGSDRGPSTATYGSSDGPTGFPEPVIANGNSSPNSSTASRPVKSLPARRTSPPAPAQPAQPQQTSGFNFNFAAPAQPQQQFLPPATPAPAQPSQFVTSNERGLTLEMESTPPTSTTTLQSAALGPPISTNFAAPATASAVSPASPPMSGGSRNSTPSPSSSGQGATSPRPAVKPLPRRTGCAPRPRPPPRATPVSTPAATTTSARSSIVLPPASNPSLASTTLSALLRPNLPAPKISPEMEERLSAMAGRMGVGSDANAARRSVSVPGVNVLPSRGPSFSFGPTALPGVNTGLGSALAPLTEQHGSSPSA
ncbi:hypothetical protein FRC10_011703 [Ceratobasidium sp. 414]|nr:hypothetical protein FRC10_011703 [Ceratobasidium sp. 414]